MTASDLSKQHGDDRVQAVVAVILGACLALGLAAVVAGLIELAGQTRTLHNVAFAISFGVLLPLGALGTLATLRRSAGPSSHGALAAFAGLCVLLIAMRLAGMAGAGADATAALGIVGGLAIAGGSAALALGRLDEAALPSIIPPAWRPAAAVVLLVAALLVFVPAQIGAILVLVSLATAALAWRLGALPGPPRPGRKAGIALDLGFVVLLGLLALDVTGYWGPDAGVSTWAGVPESSLGPIVQVHQHFYLGPVADVLSGRTLLVDSNAVYGIGNTYLLAGWFQLVPFGYGTLGLVGSLATAAALAMGWAIARLAGAGRAIAAAALLIAAFVTVLAPITSPGLFLNVSGFRFAPALLLVLVAVLVATRPGPVSRAPAVLGVFALFAVWSVEAVAYCTTVMIALALADGVATRSLRAGARLAVVNLLVAAAAFAVAHAALALVTLAASGDLPDWGAYFDLFRAWAEVLEETFGGAVEAWSRAWVVGAAYLVSGLGAMVLLLRLGDDAAGRRRTYALVGTTAAGAAFLSYFVAHSFDLFLPFVVLPALVIGAIWLQMAFDAGGTWRRAALSVAALLAFLLVAGSWDEATRRLPRTALAHIVPGGPSLEEDLRRMWASPRIDPRAPAAAELIERNIPGEEAVVLVEPDLGQEALTRSGRVNRLPLNYPWQDEVVMGRALPPILEAAGDLPLGTRVLLQDPPPTGTPPTPALHFERTFGNVPADGHLGPLAAAADQAIRDSYRLELVERGPGGLYVAEITGRR